MNINDFDIIVIASDIGGNVALAIIDDDAT